MKVGSKPENIIRLKATIKRLTKEIGIRRDKLRELHDELIDVLESMDEGLSLIESGIDRLSEHL